MSAIPGTNIADKIVPFDTNDTYATHDEMYGKGGWRSVQTITDRDLIPLERRTDRMVVNILDSGQAYQLKNGTSNSNWESFTVDVSGLDISINNIGPDINGNFNIIGSSSVLVSSNPLTNTILISAGDSVKTYLLPGYGIGITEDVENSYTIAVTGSFGDAALRSEVEAITGNLQSQLLLQYNSINDIYSTYTNSATTSAISAGLSSRIDSIVIPDVSNFITTSEVALISSGLNSRLTSNELLDTQQTNSINDIYSTYTNSATTSAISAGLSSRIDSIIQDGTTISSSGSTIVYNKYGINYNLEVADYIGKTEVALISSGLNSRLTSNELLDTQQTNSINTLFSTYTNSATTQAISAGLDARILAISASDLSNYTPIITTQAISAGLDARITSLTQNTIGITGGLAQIDNTFVHLQGDENINGIKTFTDRIIIVNGASVGTGAGAENTVLGIGALQYNTSGESNVAVGTYSLNSLIDGSLNVAIGANSLYSCEDGAGNIAIGNNSLQNNVHGESNVAIGTDALFSSLNGQSNIAIGYGAGFNETGSNKLYIANIAGTSGDALIYGEFDRGSIWIKGNEVLTTASGYTTLTTTQAISAGLSYRIDNISSSSISGNYLPISGGTLTGLVILKGVSNPGTASYNESFGSNALQNSSAMHNTAFGHRAGMSLTTGASNTLFGSSAGLNLVDSYGNVAIGYSAMGSANGTLAGSNTAIGTQALYSLTNGFSNIAIGSGAMTTSKLTAKENISIGQNSLNTSNGDSNVAIGSSAGFGMVGDRNIVIGKYAGYGNTGTDQLWIDSRDTFGTTSGSAFLYGEMTAGRLFIKGSRVATLADVPSNLQGSQALDTSNILYTISHSVLSSLSRYPIITLQVPTSASNLMVAAVTNRTLSSFDVILSQSPNTSGYYINWSIVG